MMKEVKIDGEKIKLFKDAEELKWYFHKLLCEGDATAEFYMNRVVEEDLADPKKLNEWLENTPYRVKELEES